jgi:hypothetical protein
VSKKSSRKGKQTPNRQQQQEAAARRRNPALGATGRVPTPGTSPAPAQRQPGSTPAAASEPKGSAQVRHYLDISAVRIQEWLARTPDLKFRRGASVMLSEATGQEVWPDDSLPPGMSWNIEAGDLDGVVSLVVDVDVPSNDIAGCLASAAREVAAALRHELPHCPIQAVAGAGDSYATAYEEIERARRDGDHLVDSPPPPAELVLAKPCDQCRRAPAEHAKQVIVGAADPEDLCGECLTRVQAAGRTKGAWERGSPRPERRMKGALVSRGIPGPRFPDDFRDLAEAGRQASDDAATQLALIYADGNRVGAFLSEVAAYAREHGNPPKSEIVRALDKATLTAVADAVITCFTGHDPLPVLAHLAGGDDLMMSVPAPHAWPFVRALLPAFHTRMAAQAWPPPVAGALPSLSAGLVFHHQSAPFPDVVRLAKDQLDKAKTGTRGDEPSVAFVDLTADGGQAPAEREALTVDDLNGLAGCLDQIARIPRSHLQTLVTLHRRCAEPAEGEADQAEMPTEAFARRVIDLGYQQLWDVVTGPDASASDVRSALVSDEGTRNELRRVLDLARWWPRQEPTKAAPPTAGPSARQEVPA